MSALNRVIEEVVKKQIEEVIVYLELLDEKIIETSKNAKKNAISFGTPSTSNADLNKKLAESDKLLKDLKKQYDDQAQALAKLTKKVEEHTKARAKQTQEGRNAVIESREERKILDGNAIATSELTTYIQKLSVERNKASRVVADFNAMQKMGIALTEEQSNELAQATVQFQKYDAAIKAGKASIGDAREYVGQYERANVGLSNSIGQIARELPSATFGFQTFALGISNNIPIAVDEIKKAVAANKDLIKKGEEIIPVWKQVGNALLSFNTIMSVGLLLIALYGKEIANFTKQLFGASDALDEVNKRQQEFNKSKLEGKKDAQSDIIELRKYLAVVKDRTIADDLRQVALKKLRADYPYYFKNLTDEQILTGKTSAAVKQLTIDLEKQKEVQRKTDLNVQNRQRLVQLEDEIDKTNILLKKANEKTKQAENLSLAERSRSQLLTQAQDEEAKQRTKINSLINERDIITGKTIKNEEDIFNLKTQTIALEYQETKATEENTKSLRLNTKAREDFLASEYELWKIRTTNLANANKALMEDEAIGYNIRLAASEQYYQNTLDLTNKEAQEEIRVLKFVTDEKLRTSNNEYLNDKDRLNKQLNDEKTTAAQKTIIYQELADNEKYFQESRTGIIKDATNKQNIIYENQAEKLVQANLEMIGKMKRAYDDINFGKAVFEISSIDLENIEQITTALSKIGKGQNTGEIEKDLQKINLLSAELALDIRKREAQLTIDREENNIKRLTEEINATAIIKNLSKEQTDDLLTNNKALQDAELKLLEAKKEAARVNKELVNQQIEDEKRIQKAKEDTYQFTLDSAIRLNADLGSLGNQLSQNTIDRYDRQIAKDNAYYDSLLANAEKGSEQEKLILAEKARNEEEIQRRKIEVQRKQAMFNKFLAIAEITLNLMQELSKNAATTGTIPAQALNAIAIASAGLRTATVLATPLPQYEKGRLGGPEEDAVINEKRIEPVESTDGKVRIYQGKNRVVRLKKNDIVHTSVEEFNKKKLGIESAAIMASFTNQSHQLQAFDYYLGRELNGISDKIEKGIERGFKNAKISSNTTINLPSGGRNTNFYN